MQVKQSLVSTWHKCQKVDPHMKFSKEGRTCKADNYTQWVTSHSTAMSSL